ncbi:hypothetical protein DSO57_1032566 [Entomophthora muscae]|uniref:Uncharacterized protein n=1 Tax=Entomophthora muscae TaxID=34485 RepID=A0ACC2RRC6_9FUNG|nr:hypothetical protein DSO57_1032566 [Entomophthora muscae]
MHKAIKGFRYSRLDLYRAQGGTFPKPDKPIPGAAKFMKMIEDNSHRITSKGMTWCQPVHLPSPAPSQ